MTTGAVVDPISTFLKSEQALKILGLPGLALLLAFVFYKSLVSAKLVRPIGRNQSFIILLMIIGYFLIVSVLIIWVYRPERGVAQGSSQPIQAKVEEPSTWSKIDALFVRTDLDTPLATFDSVLGPATRDAPAAPGNAKLRKRTYSTMDDGVVVTVGHDGDTVRWIAAFDNAQKLRIPTMHMGQGMDDGSERNFERLSDFDLDFVSTCDAKIEAPFAGRNGLYAVSPCYFGRPGGYNNYAFIFEIGGGKATFSQDCGPLNLKDGESIALWVKRCHAEQEKPFGFIVASDEEALPTAIEAFFDTLDH